MSSLAMLVYIAVLLAIAVLVHRTFPPPHVPDLVNESRMAAFLFFLFFFVAPVLCSWFLADQIRCWVEPGLYPPAMERVAQVVGAIITILIVIRGITVWLVLVCLGAIGYGLFALGSWILKG